MPPASYGWQATLRLSQPAGFTDNGVVAQLGERELCKLEVVGSIPIDSTSLRSRNAREGCHAEALLGEGGRWHPASFRLRPSDYGVTSRLGKPKRATNIEKLEARERRFSLFCLLRRQTFN